MTWADYRWRLVPDPRWVRLPLDAPAESGWQDEAAGRLLPPDTPQDQRADLARQLEFWLGDCQERAVPTAFALVPEQLATVAALAELHTYMTDPGNPEPGTIEWLSHNLAVDQQPATGPAIRERVELPAGPAIRLRAVYAETPDQEGSGMLVERVMHAVRPPQIGDMLLLSTTWAVLALGDELAARADELAESLRVEPVE